MTTKKHLFGLLVLGISLFAILIANALVNFVSANSGNMSLQVSSSVAAGQQDVPLYIYYDSNGSDVSFIGCEVSVDNTLATFSHFADDDGGFTSDFAGPNGTFDSGGVDEVSFYASTGGGTPVSESSNIEVLVLYYDIAVDATGAIDFTIDTSDLSECQVQDDGGNAYSIISAGTTITNVAGASVDQSSGNTTVAEGGSSDSFTIVLNSQPSSDVIINISTGSEINASATSLTFTNLDWDTPQTVTINAVNDSNLEGIHSDSVSMDVDNASDASYLMVDIPDVAVDIVDNDGLTVQFTQSNYSDTESTGGNLPLLVVSGADISGAGDESIEIQVTGGSAVNGDDYTMSSPLEIVIPEDNYTTPINFLFY